MGHNFYKKLSIVVILSCFFVLFQNCGHLQKNHHDETPLASQVKSIQEKPLPVPIEDLSPKKILALIQEQVPFNSKEELEHKSALFDLNADGKIDVVFNNSNESQIEVFLNTGEILEKTFTLPTSDKSFSQPLILDLNSDQKKDIVAASTGGLVNVWLQQEDGTYYERLDFNTSLGKTGVVKYISPGDVNNDGHTDIAVGLTKNRLGGFVAVLINNGLGILSLKQIMVGEGLAPYKVFLKDLNQDGFSELFFTSAKDNKLYIYENKNGKFTLYSTIDHKDGESPADFFLRIGKTFEEKSIKVL